MSRRYPRISRSDGDVDGRLFKHAQAINGLLDGQVNSVVEVTLEPDAEETEVKDYRLSPDTVLILSPKTASAAQAVSSTYYEPHNGSVKIRHASSPSTDRRFGAVFFG